MVFGERGRYKSFQTPLRSLPNSVAAEWKPTCDNGIESKQMKVFYKVVITTAVRAGPRMIGSVWIVSRNTNTPCKGRAVVSSVGKGS